MRFTNILLSTTLLTTVFGAHKVMAQVNCATIPDCASLGYSSTESSCNGSWLYCPFNSAYKKCVPSSASCEGFTKDDKTSWCKTIVPCAGDSSLTLCADLIENDCSEFTLDNCSPNGICDRCYSKGTVKFKIKSCIGKRVHTTINGEEGCHRYYDNCEEAGFFTMADDKPCGEPSAYAVSANGGQHSCYAEECIICKTTCSEEQTPSCMQQCNIMEDACTEGDTACLREAAEFCNTCYYAHFSEVCTDSKGKTTVTETNTEQRQCPQEYDHGNKSVTTSKNSHGVGGGGGGCTASEDCYSGATEGGSIRACLECDYVYNMQDETMMIASLSKEEARQKYCQSKIDYDDFPVYNS